MAAIKDIKLSTATNWYGVAGEALKLLAKDEPQSLSVKDQKALIESYTPHSDAVLTMHTSMTYQQALDWTLVDKNARKGLKKDEEPDNAWMIIGFFATGWKGVPNADTGEPAEFSKDGLRTVAWPLVQNMIELCQRVSNGIELHPND